MLRVLRIRLQAAVFIRVLLGGDVLQRGVAHGPGPAVRGIPGRVNQLHASILGKSPHGLEHGSARVRGCDHLGLRIHLNQTQIGIARGVRHLLRFDAVTLERRGVAQKVPRVERAQHIILRQRGIRIDVSRLRVAVHQLRKGAVLLGLPDGINGFIVGPVGLGRELHGQQIVVQSRGKRIRPRFITPAFVGQIAVTRRIQLLILGKIRLQIPRRADRLRVQAHFLRGSGIDEVALRHAQLLIGGYGIVEAVDLRALNKRGIEAA